MPELNGDIQIWAGQTVMMLLRMGIENNLDYSDRMKHQFTVDIMDSILAELNVTPEEIIKLRKKMTKDKSKTKVERIASIVGDSFAVHKNERSLMAAMIDELSKGTRWRQDALECIKGCYPQYFDGKVPDK